MNERVIEKLAESYPFRRAAKWAVYFIHKARAIKPEELIPEEKVKNLSAKLEERLKKVAEDLEKRSKK